MSTPNHGLMVTFYMKAVRSAAESDAAGRDIYHDVEHVNIIIPGDKHTEIDSIAEDDHRKKYPDEYARFKAGETAVISGTPLAEWPAMSRSLVKEWNYLNVFTVEQLSILSDTAKQTFGMGAEEWVKRAKAFLEVAKNSSEAEKYIVEAEQLRAETNELRQLVAEMGKKITELQSAPEKRGPGRPPKVHEDVAA